MATEGKALKKAKPQNHAPRQAGAKWKALQTPAISPRICFACRIGVGPAPHIHYLFFRFPPRSKSGALLSRTPPSYWSGGANPAPAPQPARVPPVNGVNGEDDPVYHKALSNAVCRDPRGKTKAPAQWLQHRPTFLLSASPGRRRTGLPHVGHYS